MVAEGVRSWEPRAELLRSTFEPRQAEVLEQVLENSGLWIPREDFADLKQAVRDLTVSHHSALRRLDRVESAIEQLTQAQQRSEQRLDRVEAAIERLTEAQQRSEERLGRVEAAIERLTEAQQCSEERLGRVEAAIERLAEAQQRTEQALGKLSYAVEQLQKQVGGLSDRFGGDIEDTAAGVLYAVLTSDLGWKIPQLGRQWQTWGDGPEEVDVFGQAQDPTKPGEIVWIVGEAKFNLTEREVSRFVKKVERARKHLEGEVFPVCFCYRVRPEVQQAVLDAGLRLAFSSMKLLSPYPHERVNSPWERSTAER
jgi:tetratricopeptide (TPR) repeat protein